jgi:hypothetical protein
MLLPAFWIAAIGVASAQAPMHATSPAAHAGLGDRSEFDAWLGADKARGASYDSFVGTLRAAGVEGVLEPWTLWRQGTDADALSMPRFAVPPREQWSAIIPTLRLIRDRVVPVVGPVEVASGYRTRPYNIAAKGAPKSDHLRFGAVDIVPTREWQREELHAALLRLHGEVGQQTRMGLGLYSGLRFHVDTRRFRRW